MYHPDQENRQSGGKPGWRPKLSRQHGPNRERHTATVETISHKKRRKLTKLIQSKPSKNKHHHQKKRNADEEHNVDVNTSTVINVSNVPLSDSELSILSKSLSFSPKPSHVDKFQPKEDINQFTRTVRLKEFFDDPDTTTEHIEMDPF